MLNLVPDLMPKLGDEDIEKEDKSGVKSVEQNRTESC